MEREPAGEFVLGHGCVVCTPDSVIEPMLQQLYYLALPITDVSRTLVLVALTISISFAFCHLSGH